MYELKFTQKRWSSICSRDSISYTKDYPNAIFNYTVIIYPPRSFQVIALGTLNDENKFYFYNDTITFSGEPHVYSVQFEDNLLVSEEVYSRLAFSNPKLR